MIRGSWTDILPRYWTFIDHIRPILSETMRIIEELDENQLFNIKKLDEIRKEEEKRTLRKVRSSSEFSAMFRFNVYEIIKDFIVNNRDKIKKIKDKDALARYETYRDEINNKLKTLKLYITHSLSEAINALDFLRDLTNLDQTKSKKNNLYLIVKFMEKYLFPRGKNLQEIYEQLLEHSPHFFECQRHLILPHTYYREKIEDPDFFIIPGITPKIYQMINNITSLYNLDPNYGVFSEEANYELPLIFKDDVFLPYIGSIAHEEEESIQIIAERIGLCLLEDVFIAPQEEFADILLNNNFLREEKQSDGKTRLIPQLSNESLVLHYIAFAALRRGFLSKEIINWIAMNFAVLLYKSILKFKLSEDNIFYEIFEDFQTSEKILPYLMKLICFPNYLGLDKMKIRDSPQYRKEIFNFIGAEIDNLKEIINEIAAYCEKIEK